MLNSIVSIDEKKYTFSQCGVQGDRSRCTPEHGVVYSAKHTTLHHTCNSSGVKL
ncbi:MAG: hypothetical protein ACK5JU_06805 [Bacteroidales bacterium]